MSKTESSTPAPLEIPADSDERHLLIQEYEDPILKASVWFHKLVIHRIRDVQAVMSWYLGDTDEPPVKLISDLFSQEDGRLCKRFSYYCRMLKKYKQGNVPNHIIDTDYRDVKILIKTLSKLADDTETLRHIKRQIREFVDLITSRQTDQIPHEDYCARIDEFYLAIINLFGRISDQFKRLEQIRRGERAVTATKADVKAVRETAETTQRKTDALLVKQDAALASLSDTSQTVRTIEKYVKKSQRKSRSNYTPEQLNSIHTLWLTAKNDPSVKSSSKRKACIEAALIHFKNEFAALGVTTVEDLKKALKAWSKRYGYGVHEK